MLENETKQFIFLSAIKNKKNFIRQGKHIRLNFFFEALKVSRHNNLCKSVSDHFVALVCRIEQRGRVHEVVDDAREGCEPATAVDRRHGSSPKAQKPAGRKAGVDGVLDVRLAAVALDDALSAGKPE